MSAAETDDAAPPPREEAPATPAAPAEPAVLAPAAVDRLLVTLLIGVFALVVVRTAWMSDDAYITLRTVDNFVSGHGLTWNTFERVQAYTHPLWMFVLSAFYFVTREAFFTSIFVGLLTSTAAVLLLARRIMPTPRIALVGVLALLLSRSFVDYSTSGLENPLLHLLLAIFVVREADPFGSTEAPDDPARRRLHLTIVAALVMLTRLDAILLIAPVLALAYWRVPWREGLKTAALGFLPLVLWELFSLVYYGFVLPNTAYAKLGHGIHDWHLLSQGVIYYIHQLSHDPLALVVIGGALAAAVASRDRRSLLYALGIGLYLLYILRIGGDFMAGRFFTAPLFLAVATLGRIPRRLPTYGLAGIAGLVALIGLGVAQPTITSDREFGVEEREGLIDRGVADERAFYYPHSGLLRYVRGVRMPSHPWLRGVKGLRKAPERVHVMLGIGMIGYVVGPEVRIIDIYGLADPLIARLPAKAGKGWRIGHFDRHVPAGYVETLEDGEDRFVDAELGEYSRQLRLITAGPIFSGERWAAIWRMNTGQLDALIDVDFYRKPLYSELPAYALTRPKDNGYGWQEIDTYRIPKKEGLTIRFAERQKKIGLDVSLANNDDYTFQFIRGVETVTTVKITAKKLKEGGMRRMVVAVPTPLLAHGYDAVRVHGLAKDGKFSIGHLIPTDAKPTKDDDKKDKGTDKGKDKKKPAAKKPPAKKPAPKPSAPPQPGAAQPQPGASTTAAPPT
jgi:arabinofuranosyltransferase